MSVITYFLYYLIATKTKIKIFIIYRRQIKYSDDILGAPNTSVPSINQCRHNFSSHVKAETLSIYVYSTYPYRSCDDTSTVFVQHTCRSPSSHGPSNTQYKPHMCNSVIYSSFDDYYSTTILPSEFKNVYFAARSSPPAV